MIVKQTINKYKTAKIVYLKKKKHSAPNMWLSLFYFLHKYDNNNIKRRKEKKRKRISHMTWGIDHS